MNMGRADIHCHTNHSGFNRVGFVPFPESVTPPSAMVDTAAKAGLDVLCITDHNSVKGAHIARSYASGSGLDIRVVVGEEVSTLDGEILGLFIEDFIPRGLSAWETIDLIHGQGGLAIAPHPFSYQCPSLGGKISSLPLDGVEILNAGHRDHYVNKIAGLQCGSGCARVGSSDAHTSLTLGNAWTTFSGDDPEELFKAVKWGRTQPCGDANTLGDYIGWSVEVAHEVSRKILTPDEDRVKDDPLGRIYQMRSHNKAIALAGSALYASTPLPLVAGAIGEGLVRHRGRKMWNEVMGVERTHGLAWMANLWRQLLR
ncbi:MAG: PHP-associated domain-containing protein [Methanobacteriota archaeon]